MFKSKSSPADQSAPTGDSAATQRLTGTPTAGAGVPVAADPGATAGGRPLAGGAPGATGAPASAPGTTAPGAAAKPATHAGPSVVKRTTSNVKRVALLVIGALVALFAVFNSQNVQVHWIFGDAVNTPLIVVIVIAFAAGGVIGWLVAKLGSRSRTS